MDHPRRAIVAASVALKAATSIGLYLAHSLPSFDSSSTTLDLAHLEPFVRWDTVYFVRIALNGYEHEQQTAFMPGLPSLMRLGAEAGRWCRGAVKLEVADAVASGMLASAVAGTVAALCLYHLALRLSSSRSFALLTALLFLLPPSPPTLHSVPYTEPFAALFSIAGMLLHVQQRDLLAALCWAVGSGFRAQGIVLGVGFFGWRYLLERPWASGKLQLSTLLKGIPRFALLSTVSIIPFALFQAWIHAQFCYAGAEGGVRPWCEVGLGSSYGWIQSEYWDVGPFRYWTLQQLPNFLFAAPVLAMSIWASYDYYSHNTAQVLCSTLPFFFSPPSPQSTSTSSRPFLNHRLTPFIHLHTALTCLLFFASHVQIILRVCVTNPVLWWFVADLVLGEEGTGEERGKENGGGGERGRMAERYERRSKWGRRWIGYCVVWGSVSIFLWSGFLPPA